MKLADIEAQVKALAPIIKELVKKTVAEAVAQLPKAEVNIDDVIPLIDDAAVKAVNALPVPENGEKGEKGDDGEAVDLPTVELMVEEAIIRALEAIEMPKDGADGKDALDIDLLPRIDTEKSYPRGTWAMHQGGLWRSHATTDQMRGWECVINGQHDAYAEQKDVRNYEFVTVFSDGTENRKRMALPTMIYQGVWKAGSYQKGDTVTCSGSLWHCDEDTDTRPGEAQKSWTLVAKRGRDGAKAK